MTNTISDAQGEATLRPLTEDDVVWLKQLNDLCVPEVNALDLEAMRALIARAIWAQAVVRERAPLAVLVAFAKGSSYESTNYAWFNAQEEPFVYIDRVMVAEAGRRQGLGRRLYAGLFDWAKENDLPRLCCEVNEEPPNPTSLAFHRSLGFEVLTSRINPSDGKRVAMMECRLAAR